ncbi:hypothetical protein [Mycolicibacterium sediminis]|uniref:Uncharacterized protein n=1 Tax=Mycolicibacterium sediminis TaxID=1286180 RepID=A0A7I7QKD9_9MYCO|nr:hypothetical protein [Mycolicibacterium sediminis]BBY26721.1 hypothetical protein MSEDJ_08170 [Mycolicibacterium sediminis]
MSVAVTGRRACAVLAVGSAALHGLSLGHAGTPAATALMLVMIATCVSCAYDLWSRGTSRAWVLVATMNVAMVALHMPSASHHHLSGVTVTATPMGTAMAAATAIAVLEVSIAVGVLYRRSRVTARQFGAMAPG